MKKMVVMIFCLIMLFSVASASAETEKRDAFELCSLFQLRVKQLENEYGIDCNITTRSSVSERMGLGLSFDGGYASLSADYKVNQLFTLFFDTEAEKDKSVIQIFTAMMSLSALEYSDQDERITIAGEHELGIDESKNALEKAIAVWNDVISVKLNDDAVWEAIYAGEHVLVYSGNYDYYINYSEVQHADKMLKYVYLTAIAK